MKLNKEQIRDLRRQAHSLKAIINIGKGGLTDSVVEAMNEALKSHELIKVRFIAFKDEKKAISANLAEQTKSACIGTIGHISIYFKQHPQTEKRKIKIKK